MTAPELERIGGAFRSAWPERPGAVRAKSGKQALLARALATLAVPVDPDRARADARDILGDRRFQNRPAPRPLRGPLDWLGDRLQSIGDGIARLLEPVPGPTWLSVLALVALAVTLIVARALRGRVDLGAGRAGGRRADTAEVENAADLERKAAAAERAGDLDAAIRLRFRAGLLRLDERGRIRYRPSLTTGEVRRLLGSETFDDLARTFEEVAYGGRPAAPDDVAGARERWPRLLGEQEQAA